MASPNPAYNSHSSWTVEKNTLFEIALATHDKDTSDRWQNVAKAVGTTEEEVKMQYSLLLKDIALIEAGNFPTPQYESRSEQSQTLKANEMIEQGRRTKDDN